MPLLQNQKEIIYFFAAAFLPAMFCILWYSVTTQVPNSDAVQYLTTAYHLYGSFVNHSFPQGVVHLFTERGWRPIFFPVLSVPFLLLSQGNLLFACTAVAFCSVFASCIYMYLFFRLQLARFPAVIATNLIGLLPFVQMPGFYFTAECALYPLVIGALYHLIRSDYFRIQKHSIGFVICTSLAILIRPVEAVAELFFVIVFFIGLGKYKKIFSIQQVMIIIGTSLLTLFLFIIFVQAHYLHRYPVQAFGGGFYDIKLAKMLYRALMFSFIGLVLVSLMLALIHKRPWTILWKPLQQLPNHLPTPLYSPSVVIVFAAIYGIALLWFLPFAFATCIWVFQTSFGDVADISLLSFPKQALLPKVLFYIREDSLISVGGVVFLALCGAFSLYQTRIRSIITSSPFVYLLLLLPFPLWEVFNTCQMEARRISLAFSALLMALLLIALTKGKFFKTRIVLICSMLFFQWVSCLGVVYPKLVLTKQMVFGRYLMPITIQPNPHDIIMGFLEQVATHYHLKNIVIEQTWARSDPIYPYLLEMMSELKLNGLKQEMNLSFPFYSSYSDDIARQLSKENEGALLIGNREEMAISNKAAQMNFQQYQQEINPALKNLDYFLYYHAQGRLEEIGWKLGPCINVMGSDYNLYQSCLLISLNRTTMKIA